MQDILGYTSLVSDNKKGGLLDDLGSKSFRLQVVDEFLKSDSHLLIQK